MPPLNDRARPPLRLPLTPLIDVVFILLVFFMLATNFFDWRGISLAAAGGSGTTGTALTGARLVELTPAGPRLGGLRVSPDALLAQARAWHAADPLARILVMPRAGADTRALVALLDALDAAGLTDITLLEPSR